MDSYEALRNVIKQNVTREFPAATANLLRYLENITNITDLMGIIQKIGIIPEDVIHDSTEEKLYAKVSDMVLARALYFLGYQTHVLTKRADAADVVAKSRYHNYGLVGDAKTFRLSRTAHNQKDFKVTSLNNWKQDKNYAMLCAPYFAYPIRNSQIYRKALEDNVTLFSWEYLLFLLKNHVKETTTVNLQGLWKLSADLAKPTLPANETRFIEAQNQLIKKLLHGYVPNIQVTLAEIFTQQDPAVQTQGASGRQYWQNQITQIQALSREAAISELLDAKQIDRKLQTINKTIKGMKFVE